MKRKILFLIPSLRGGGAERTLINLLYKIDFDKYDIDLIVVSKKGPYLSQIPADVNVHFLFNFDLTARSLTYLHRRFGFDWVFKRKMSRITKNYDVGISFLDSTFTNFLFYTDNIDKRVAFVHSSYLTHKDYIRFFKDDEYREKVKRERYSRLDAIYFVSHDSMSDFVRLFGKFPNMNVVYNLIDRKAIIDKSRQETEFTKPDCFTFSAVGSLLPVKGYDRLIKAARIVRDKGYSFQIHLAGSGPEKHNLKRMIKEFNLENHFILHGFLKNPYPLMKNSDVFVMSSISEALPTVLCEAMILGLPSLVTDCSGCRGLVDNGVYGIMSKQDEDDIAEKMMLYMDNPNLLQHFRKKSLERAELFDDERILNSYYDIFDGVEIETAI